MDLILLINRLEISTTMQLPKLFTMDYISTLSKSTISQCIQYILRQDRVASGSGNGQNDGSTMFLGYEGFYCLQRVSLEVTATNFTLFLFKLKIT
jgi:hypothetical protein